ncbi:hypothetical protein GQ457_07G002670 [Hibiscus cannabinus]
MKQIGNEEEKTYQLNNEILQEILKQLKLVSKQLGIVDDGEISDARKVEDKKNDPSTMVNQVTVSLHELINTIYPQFGVEMLERQDEETGGECIIGGVEDINEGMKMIYSHSFPLITIVLVYEWKFGSVKVKRSKNIAKSFFLRIIGACRMLEPVYSTVFTNTIELVEWNDPYEFHLLLMGNCITQITRSSGGVDITLSLENTYLRVLGLNPHNRLLVKLWRSEFLGGNGGS